MLKQEEMDSCFYVVRNEQQYKFLQNYFTKLGLDLNLWGLNREYTGNNDTIIRFNIPWQGQTSEWYSNGGLSCNVDASREQVAGRIYGFYGGSLKGDIKQYDIIEVGDMM